MFKPKSKTPRDVINAAIRKKVYEKTRVTPRRQQNFLISHFDGQIPLNAYGKGNALNWYENGNIHGTHARRIKGRENIPKSMITRGTKNSLYF